MPRERRWLFLALLGAVAAALALGDRLPYTPGARYSDAVTAHFPAALYLRESIARGELPLWRDTIMGGQPFLANPLNKTAYPLQWLALLLPSELHLNLLLLLHTGIAAWGMWTWARRLGLRDASAALAAVAYALSPRLLAHAGAGHLDIVYALAWFPWLMAAVERMFTVNADAPTWRDFGAVAVFAVLIFLADTRSALFAFGLAIWYAGHLAINQRGWFVLRLLYRTTALVVLLTLSVWLPILQWSPYLSRAALTPAEAGVFSLELPMLLGLLVPAGRNVELLTYVGLIVLGLAFVAVIAQPRRHLYWLTVVALAGWYALGVNGWLWTTLVELFPPLLWFRVPSRAWLIIALVVPLLAGYGLDALLSRRLGRIAAYVVIGAVVVELLLTARGWIEWRERDRWLPDSQRQLAEVLLADQAQRVYSPTYSLEQSTAAVYGLSIFGGVDPFQLQVAVDAIQRSGGIAFEGYSVVQPPLIGIDGDDPATANRDALPDPAALGAWGVTHVVSAYPIAHPQLERLDAPDGVHVYANRAPAAPITRPTLDDPEIIESLLLSDLGAGGVAGISLIVCIIALFVRPARWSRRR
jgi:hypothetical protein